MARWGIVDIAGNTVHYMQKSDLRSRQGEYSSRNGVVNPAVVILMRCELRDPSKHELLRMPITLDEGNQNVLDAC